MSKRFAFSMRGLMIAVIASSVLTSPTMRATVTAAGPELSAETLTDEHLLAAIDAIVEELYSRKRVDRLWEPSTPPRGESQRQGGGTTALVVLSMLYAGQSYQDPRLRDAVEYLERSELEGTYAVAVRAHVWARLPQRFQPRLEADARWLLEAFSPRSRAWDYGHKPRSTYRDNSLRQYGALGLWEAAKRDVDTPRRLWETLEAAMLESQLPDGGWNYKGDDKPARGSMTAAGLTILFIAQDYLHAADHVRIGRRREPSHAERALQRGLTWMERHFSPSSHPGSAAHFYYYLYGVERVGLASGYKTFGTHDWFREGADELLRRLCSWDAEARTMSVHKRLYGRSGGGVIATRDLAFALMFLSRGRVPIAVNKLRVPDVAWNNRPRDAANLVRSLSDRTERALSWQIVDMASDPEQWHDAPVLYLASHEPLPWARPPGSGRSPGSVPDEMTTPLRKLETYLDRGGLLLALAEGGRGFTESIRTTGERLYPHLSWRELPPDHWIYGLHAKVNGRQPVLGLGNGVRELILLVPRGDVPKSFQLADERREDDFRLAANVYFHASEMNRPRPRLGRATVVRQDETPPSVVSVVRTGDDTAPIPEPAALPEFGRWLAASRNVTLEITDTPLAGLGELSERPTLVACSGVESRTFTEQERDAVRRYVQAGGVILFETAGGRGPFATSAEQQMSTLFGVEPTLLNDSSIVTGAGLPDGARLSKIGYRPFALSTHGLGITAPRLRGLVIDGQPRVLFSHEDLSHALLDQPCWGVSGYTTDGSRHLLWNAVQHAGTLSSGSDGPMKQRSDGGS